MIKLQDLISVKKGELRIKEKTPQISKRLYTLNVN